MIKLKKYAKILIFIMILPLFSPICIKDVSASATAFYSQAECVMEQSSKRILYAYSSDKALPIASTTKILTALTVIENTRNQDKIVTVPQEAAGIEGSSVYLKAGEERSIKDLLYGLMLRSGNDCAAALALSVAPSQAAFSSLMNYTAQKCGALKSNFVNPHGLHHEKHYSTAKDLCYIMARAMNYPLFREIVQTKYYEPCGWVNKNKLLTQYNGCIGGKTGYTKKAGKCLVSVAKRQNSPENGQEEAEMTLICSVLNCPTTYDRTKTLFNDAFERYQMYKILSSGEKIETENGVAMVKTDVFYPLLTEEIPLLEREIVPVHTPFSPKNEKIIAQIKIRLANHLIFSGNLYKL